MELTRGSLIPLSLMLLEHLSFGMISQDLDIDKTA